MFVCLICSLSKNYFCTLNSQVFGLALNTLIKKLEVEGSGEFETVTVIEINYPIFTYGYQTSWILCKLEIFRWHSKEIDLKCNKAG